MSYLLVVCEDEPHSRPYVEALKAVGAREEEIRVLTPDSPRELRAPEAVQASAARAAGILLTGGPDVLPATFGEEPLPGANLSLLPELDPLEFAALAGARDTGVPVWAVCRGMQVLNVFFGGSLYQDLPMQRPGLTDHQLSTPRDALVHEVVLRGGRQSPLGQALGRERTLVNSRHHQAVKALAAELEVVAISPDGLIEAVVHHRDGWWVQAVQWHPENLLPLAQQRALWRQFVEAAADRSRRETPEDPLHLL